MEIKKVGVLGCGLMGSGIVQTLAMSGVEVVVREAAEQYLDKGLGKIGKQLARAVAKGKMSQEKADAVMAGITGTLDLDDFADCDAVIEAVTENLELKQELWAALDKICKPETIFASNTSSILISKQAVVTERKDQFIGMHFFNPVPVMKLVELIRTDETSDATYESILALSATMGKKPVTCRDTYGFIVNRLLVPYLLDAIRALEAGIASREDIDMGMKLGCGHPMGPLTLLDFVGLDTALYIAGIMHDAFKLEHYKAPQLLQTMVADGKLGAKSGQGFYSYR
jgi:3-hydroxybutyryl-CoA dehydrogenase